MPDKQIVIKLDDEQFETIMRLALAAGYSSLDKFASERLKQALQGDSQSKDKSAASGETPERFDEAALTLAAEELNRIHQELRVFIKEAVTDSEKFADFDFAAAATPPQTNDQWEELADIAFSNSPRLGNRSEQRPLPKEDKSSADNKQTGQTTEQTEPDPYGFRAVPPSEDANPTPGGFSDLSGGPPPRKRSK